MHEDDNTAIGRAVQAIENCLYEAPANASDEELQEYDHYYYGSLWSEENGK